MDSVADCTLGPSQPRSVKRQKTDTTPSHSKPQRPSRIFAPFRTVGLVSPTNVPFQSVPLGKTTFQITTSVGRSLQTYDLNKGLNLVFLSRPQTPGQITATVTWNDKILVAYASPEEGGNSGLWVLKRGKRIDELPWPSTNKESVNRIVVFGSWIVAYCETLLEVWNSATQEHYTTIHPRKIGAGAKLSGGMCSMPTFLNKIFVGRASGSVEIWNISTGKLIHTLRPPNKDLGAVTAIESAPALSLLAIAYESGPVVIRNVRTDREVLRVNKGISNTLPVTSITFRTDGVGAGEDGQDGGVMATASQKNGDVTFWDLNKGGRKMGILSGAHAPPSADGNIAGGVTRVEFLVGQAIMVTCGMDNSLKTWTFDKMPYSPVPHILHARSGHHAPISTLQFLPSETESSESVGKWLMSGSHDRSFWGWSLRRDGQSTEISQGAIRKRAKKAGLLNQDMSSAMGSLEQLRCPRITSIACSLNRDGGIGAIPGKQDIWTVPGRKRQQELPDATISGATGWESVVTAHAEDRYARTWFWGRKRAGRWMFETGDSKPVSSVAISACGTFALLGSTVGGIDMYNLQSGQFRQRFPPPKKQGHVKAAQFQRAQALLRGEDTAEDKASKHTKAVTGIEVDNLNKTVFSCGADGKIKFWAFSTGLLLHQLDWGETSLLGMRYHRPSELIAIACSDSCIRIVDTETRKLVRELFGSVGLISDFTFTSDGRWIIAASADSTVRVWDLSTGFLIEALRFKSKPTSIAFSPSGEYLATAHEDSVGVQVWTNRTLFTHVPTRQIAANDVIDMDGPTASGQGGVGIVEAAFADEDTTEDLEDILAPTVDQISSDLLTLSLVPKPRWQTLLHLDIVRERNRPKEAPKAPEKAPFFLPSLANGLQNGSSAGNIAADAVQSALQETQSKSRVTSIEDPAVAAASKFTNLLQNFDASALVSHLASLPPSSADLAIRTLDPSPPYVELTAFVGAIKARLLERRDYELVQTWMSVFLKCHSSVLTESEELRTAVREWKVENDIVEQGFGDTVGFCKGVSGWVGGVI